MGTAINRMIADTPEMQAEQAVEEATAPHQPGARADTIGDALAPVLNWEKSDVQFWMQVVQLLVLLLILREVRGGSL